MRNNEKGIALITTLILGLVALAFIGALLYMLTSGTKISGVKKRYYTALEAAKGGAEIIMTNILTGKITCNNGNPCTPCPNGTNANCKIDINPSNFGNYNIDAYLLLQDNFNFTTIYSIRIIAYNPDKPNEKAEIEFAYKVKYIKLNKNDNLKFYSLSYSYNFIKKRGISPFSN